MIITSLTVTNIQEQIAKKINLKPGLNIIFGENKTGKSSLIKSIFHTMGCEVYFEDEWTKLIDIFYLEFSFNNKNYLLKRLNKQQDYTLVDLDKNVIIFHVTKYDEFCKKFLNLFDINFSLNTKKNAKEVPVPPAAIFNFNYIDQDTGWNLELANNFSNLKYLQNVKNTVIKYVVGETTNKFFSLKTNRNILQSEISKYENEINSINKFLNRVQQQLPKKKTFQIEEFKNIELVRINTLEQLISSKKILLNEFENEIKELRDSIKYMKLNIKELNKDFDFSNEIICDNIECPICGTVHLNNSDNKFNFLSDINKLNELVYLNRQDIKSHEKSRKQLIEELHSLNIEYNELKSSLENHSDYIGFIDKQKELGMVSLIEKNNNETKRMQKILTHKSNLSLSLKKKIDLFTTKERKNTIKKSLAIILEKNIEPLNLESTSKFKLTNYMLIKKNISGSDGPRVILNYYASLYTYNLKRNNYPFQFFVVDTPNQQGQDKKNLKIIDDFIGSLDTDGQIILGTERKTGYEDSSNVITLINKRQSLNQDDYKYHKEYENILTENPASN